MPDSPDDTQSSSDADDDAFERRLRALVADAGADAPPPPDFTQEVASDQLSMGRGRSLHGRRLAVGLGCGALTIAAALALFFVLPRDGDDSLVISDTATVAPPDSGVVAPSATDSTPTTTVAGPSITTTSLASTTPATTTPATTNPSATAPLRDPTPIEVVDVPGQTVIGVRIFEAVDVEAVAGKVSAQLGPPTLDSGWRSMAGQFDCTGSTNYRVLWWGDLRMSFERHQGDGAVRDELSEWTVGEPTLFGFVPIGDIPTAASSNIVTLEGIGLGATRDEVEAAWSNVHEGGDNRLVVVDRGGALIVTLDDDGQVVGFGNGPFDCPSDEPR